MESGIQMQYMAHGRWYAIGIVLADGRIMAFSGLNEKGVINNQVEFYTVGSGWSSPFTAPHDPNSILGCMCASVTISSLSKSKPQTRSTSSQWSWSSLAQIHTPMTWSSSGETSVPTASCVQKLISKSPVNRKSAAHFATPDFCLPANISESSREIGGSSPTEDCRALVSVDRTR
jgi:hypothetical protein